MVYPTEKFYEISRQREACRVDVDCLLTRRIKKYDDGAVWGWRLVIDGYEKFLRGCGIDDLLISEGAKTNVIIRPFWCVVSVIRGVGSLNWLMEWVFRCIDIV